MGRKRFKSSQLEVFRVSEIKEIWFLVGAIFRVPQAEGN